MGRSRGGLTTKVHALVDANGLPIALKLTCSPSCYRSDVESVLFMAGG
jgi:transposase